MSRMYNQEEKRDYVDRFKVSGKSKTEYARNNGIPEATFRAWLKEEQYGMFGSIDINESESQLKSRDAVKPIIFCDENIRVELREGYNKEYLKQIIEVIAK